MDDVEKQLISTIKNLDDTKPDEEGAFGDSVAARLRCLSPRQKAVAYIEIDKVLLGLKYPNDPYRISSKIPAPLIFRHPLRKI